MRYVTMFIKLILLFVVIIPFMSVRQVVLSINTWRGTAIPMYTRVVSAFFLLFLASPLLVIHCGGDHQRYTRSCDAYNKARAIKYTRMGALKVALQY